MYLKSVEIHGFKSFANRMVLSFGNGITGIVGPNGSGKSNVADAVRWVLGEQSAKQLRGAKMEDVIFSGTKIKKAQSFAYVAITLDNSDHVLPIEYEEITVARRVYRSGESEYLINGNNCRLRDVQELFLDTGIGKEGYSIIGQGQIEKIISGKPEDRRDLFDEAAGITKFKKRKAEAIKNLSEETDNLDRVNDIMRELEGRLAPLEKQSEKARQFLSYRDELKKYEMTYFVSEYDRAEEFRLKAEIDREIAHSSLISVNEELTKTKAEYEGLGLELEEKNRRIEDLDLEVSESKLLKEKLEGSIKVLEEKINTAKNNHENFSERLKKSEEKIESLETEKEEEEKKRDRLKEKEATLKAELETKAESLNQTLERKKELSSEKEKKLSERIRYEKEKAEAGGQIELYQINLEQTKIKKLEVNQKIIRNKEVGDTLRAKLIESDERCKAFDLEINKMKLALESHISEVNALKLRRVETEKEYKNKQKEILEEKAVLDSLKNMAERYDGYGYSVKHVMEHRKEEPGIIGVVADIIKVKESYELAIETAMGGSIQNIVVDREETAKRTIQWLKKKQYGRVTFLPLDAMGLHNPGNFGGALNETGILGVAASLVEFEPRFAGVVSHILGRTLVADNMETATKIARKYRYGLRIVTLEGEQLNPGGSLTGGAFRNSNNLLGRAREIEERAERLSKHKEELTIISNRGKEISEAIEENKKSIEIYKSSLSEMKVNYNTEVNAGRQLEERLLENERLLSEIYLDVENLEKEKENVLSEISRLNGILSSEGKMGESTLKMLVQEIEKLDLEVEEIGSLVREKNLELGSLHSELGFKEDNISRLMREITEILIEIEDLKENNQNFASILEGYYIDVEEYEEKIKRGSIKVELLTKEREGKSTERDRLIRQNKELFKQREELAETRSNLEKEILRLNNNIEKAENNLSSLVEYMAEEYHLTYSEIIKEYKQEEDLSSFALKKLINHQKNLIRELGPVNVNSIEEYKEVSERYHLLKRQHDDIVMAEETLRKVIEELDTKMREQFEISFRDINLSFDKVFSELFGGGRGRLELIEGEDILEAGIRIVAEPPGKKLQNMMQLSGGEKSLTAISLLFAIQNLKPSPFCLLDEIEAALDDSNVVRFADYLHRLTKDTQFIVITHRRGTMNTADVLYGITMQEKGISTMVSVNLIEAELSN